MSFQANGRAAKTAVRQKRQHTPTWVRETRSSAMLTIERTIAQVAPTNIPVLLTGESGTGKAFVAEQIHNLSARKDKALAKVICASLADGSLGAYFGKPAELSPQERAGTVLLKEISKLDSTRQRDLLYAFSDSTAGCHQEYTGPRLICSTVTDLEEEMRSGRFRAELYYRINGAKVHLPPLRQRREDIAPLLELFLSQYAGLLGRSRPHMDAEDICLLREFHWPGNIRQLENVARKMVVLDDPKAAIAELFAKQPEQRPTAEGMKTLPLKVATRAAARGAERAMILAALDRTRWNRKRAAAELKISYKSLLCKLKEIGSASNEI